MGVQCLGVWTELSWRDLILKSEGVGRGESSLLCGMPAFGRVGGGSVLSSLLGDYESPGLGLIRVGAGIH
eukprot:8376916-Pyramimonas_sp.AAC.1